MKIGISILILFLLFLWIDIFTSQQYIGIRNKSLILKDEVLFLSAKRIEELKGISYDSIVDIIKRYNLKGVSIYNKEKELFFAIGEPETKPDFSFDSLKLYASRKIGYKGKDKYIFITASDGELRILRNAFFYLFIVKIFFYLDLFLLSYFLFRDRRVKMELKRKEEDYILESLKERLKELTEENKKLKEFKEEMESQKYLLEIGRNLSSILHEIRNSSGTIIGYSKLLKDKEIGSRILEEAFILNRLSDSLLFLAKPLYLKKENVNLKSLFLSIYVPERIKYIVKCDEDINVEIDKDLFRKAMENIIHNSINAIEKDGRIKVEVKKDDKIYITIEDNGKGMSEEEISRCFEIFYFGDKRGTGIGLWLVKRIIEVHNGEINIESKKNKGTIIRIVLNA
uniref:histidine kinase n=1 Tax=candidate division WOR-3 bacterium TaxID=2052148 RepID=A0A7C4Y5D9_UNCW3